MSIYDMSYRTKTYLAGDWDGDRDLIDTSVRDKGKGLEIW